jgi:hypothetical protein
MMRYTIYEDRAMTKVRENVITDNPGVIAAVRFELRADGVIDFERLTFPYRLESVGIVIHEM